jgi:hypothetical protein
MFHARRLSTLGPEGGGTGQTAKIAKLLEDRQCRTLAIFAFFA